MMKTVLYNSHTKLNATMIDFYGWQMPIKYAGVIEEHNAVRTNAGIFDVSHMLAVDIKGEDAKKFISFLLANDIKKIKKGKAIYSCMLADNGGIIDDLIAYYFEDDFIRIVVNAGNRKSDVEWILSKAKNYNIEITKREDLSIIAVQGPNARVKAQKALGFETTPNVVDLKIFSMVNVEDTMVARTGYTGEDGYEIILPSENAELLWDNLIAQDIAPIGLGARDTLRLEAGLNLYGQDMNAEYSPLDSGLGWTVALDDERDFIGKEALLNQKINKDYKSFVGIILEGKGILRAHQDVVNSKDEIIGKITSGSFAPTLGESIAFARLDKIEDDFFVKIRNKNIPAKIVKFPFVRKGVKVYK